MARGDITTSHTTLSRREVTQSVEIETSDVMNATDSAIA